MPNAADLNNLFDDYAARVLIPHGFEKKGIHYFKHDKEHLYAIIKHTARGFFVDYCLAYSHASAGDSFKKLLKKPSTMLKDYPVSVVARDLEIIYHNSDRLIDSPYYFCSLSRGYKIDKKCVENEKAEDRYWGEVLERYDQLSSSDSYLKAYVEDLFQLIQNEGIKFFTECNFELCYKAMLRPLKEHKKEQYIKYYQEYLDSFVAYCKENAIPIPNIDLPDKGGWLGNWFKSN
jgi:hypothetical protein